MAQPLRERGCLSYAPPYLHKHFEERHILVNHVHRSATGLLWLMAVGDIFYLDGKPDDKDMTLNCFSCVSRYKTVCQRRLLDAC